MLFFHEEQVLLQCSSKRMKLVSKVWCHGQSYNLCYCAPHTPSICVYIQSVKDSLATSGLVNGKVRNGIVTGILPRNMSQTWMCNTSHRAVGKWQTNELEAFGRASRGVHLAWTPGMSDSENTSGLIKQSAA